MSDSPAAAALPAATPGDGNGPSGADAAPASGKPAGGSPSSPGTSGTPGGTGPDAAQKAGGAGRTADGGGGAAGADSAPGQSSHGGPRTFDSGKVGGDFGQASGDHERLRAAEAGFGGDQVFGAKTENHFYGAGPASHAPPRVLSGTNLDLVRHTFVAPDGWADLRMRTQQQTVLVIRAERGTGRWALAVQLLHSRGLESLYELNAADHLDVLADVLISGAGHVLALDRDTVVAAQTLRACTERLASSGGCLVITCDRGASLGHDVQDYVLDAPPPPPPAAILQAHLRWRLGEPKADRVLALTEVAEFVAETIRATTTCRDAAALARLMAEEASGHTVDLAAVARRFEQRSDDDLDTWFERLPDLGTRTFAIALAVLHDLPYEEVAQAALRLRRHILRSEDVVHPDSDGPPLRDPFETPNRARLGHLRAYTWHTTTSDDLPATCVDFRDREMRRVLDRAWFDYDIQDPLLTWLMELAERPTSRDMIFRATAALGHLATGSFRYVRGLVFEPWAGSDDRMRRDIVARALRMPAADPLVRPGVEEFVGRLRRQKDDWRRQATACAAIGVSLGPADPEQAFRILGEFAVIDDWDEDEDLALVFAIELGFVTLLEDLPQTAPLPALRTLLAWSDDHKRRDTAHLVFLLVALDHVYKVRKVGERGGIRAVRWPGLLRLAHREPDLREPMLELWRRVLRQGYLRLVIGDVLRAWAGEAEKDDDLMVAFARLVRALGADGPARSALLGYARTWRRDDRRRSPGRAAELIESLLGAQPGPTPAPAVPPSTVQPQPAHTR